jgi:2-polyprenyl-3-methyl-5-hydroxy-6-metoxy-1,4-benzoquinol methylase
MEAVTEPGPHYFEGTRSDLLDWLGGRCNRVLEIGCGRGGNADWFRQHGATWIAGIDLDRRSAEQAATRFDSVLVGDVSDLLDELDDRFDLIVCADVLEHLADPWAVVGRLRELAAPGGRIVASIPNVRFYRALWEIAFGHGFRYAPEGIFDRTHLRFFTSATIRALLQQGGWEVRRLEPSTSRRRHLRAAIEMMTGKRSREWLTYQWFAEGRAASEVSATKS